MSLGAFYARAVRIDHRAVRAPRRRRSLVTVLVPFASTLISSLAHAQTTPADVSPSPLRDAVVVYDVPGGCPSQSDFESRLRSRSGSHAGTPVPLRRVEAHVQESAGRTAANVVITDGAGATTNRSIVAASCNEAVDALALIVALTLDPVLRADAGGAGTGDAASSTDPAMAAGKNGTASQGAPAAATPAGESSVPSAVPRDSVSARPLFGVSAGIFAASGLGPRIEPGGEAALEMVTSTGLSVRAGGRLLKSQTAFRAAGDAAFSWWAAFASVCAGTGVGSPAFLMSVCATYEFGFLDAKGSNTRNPESTENIWQALGPGIRAEWVLAKPFALNAGVEGVVPFSRQKFSIGSDSVYQVPLVTLRVQAGIALLF
jgi:hypothetical protein